jgi:hypothetical protein
LFLSFGENLYAGFPGQNSTLVIEFLQSHPVKPGAPSVLQEFLTLNFFPNPTGVLKEV